MYKMIKSIFLFSNEKWLKLDRVEERERKKRECTAIETEVEDNRMEN